MGSNTFYPKVASLLFVLNCSPVLGMTCLDAFSKDAIAIPPIEKHAPLLDSFNERYRKAAKVLLIAQETNTPVEIKDNDFGDAARGYVSQVRSEEGQLAFKINGKLYGSLYDVEARLLSVARSGTDILAAVPEFQRKFVTKLLDAQEKGHSVVVSESGAPGGGTQGEVTDIHIEDGKLVFKINGKRYQPIRSFDVRDLRVEKDGNKILAMMDHDERDAVRLLLKAQAEGLSVGLLDLMSDSELTGPVTNVRMEDGDLVLNIGGKRVEPFGPLSVRLLKVIRNPESILAQIGFLKRDVVKLLLEAQSTGSLVSIQRKGIYDGGPKGRVSNVRIEDGFLVFDIDGEQYMPFHEFTVLLLK